MKHSSDKLSPIHHPPSQGEVYLPLYPPPQGRFGAHSTPVKVLHRPSYPVLSHPIFDPCFDIARKEKKSRILADVITFGGPEGPSWGVLRAPLGAQVCQNGVGEIGPEDLGGPSGPKIGPRPHRKAPKDPPGPPQDPPRTLQDAPRTPFKPSQEPPGPPRDTPRPPGTPDWAYPTGPGIPQDLYNGHPNTYTVKDCSIILPSQQGHRGRITRSID